MTKQYMGIGEMNRGDRLLLFLHYLIVLMLGLLFLPCLQAQETQTIEHEAVGALYAAANGHTEKRHAAPCSRQYRNA